MYAGQLAANALKPLPAGEEPGKLGRFRGDLLVGMGPH